MLQREIKCSQRQARLLALSIDGTSTASVVEGGSDVTLTDNGTGDYTLAIDKPFLRAPVVVGSSLTAGIVIKVHSVSVSSITIKTYAVDGTTATDADFHLMVLGWDAASAT